jgi:hypothetical protein
MLLLLARSSEGFHNNFPIFFLHSFLCSPDQ